MINLKRKQDCCGCQACFEICPKQCIDLQYDEEGFIYPVVNEETCIDCHLCEKVCPVLNPINRESVPIQSLAARNRNTPIRIQSSSGGVFSLLSKKILDRGGIVFGVKYTDDFSAIHTFTDSENGLSAFRGSKYVQSDLAHAYSQVQAFLSKGTPVMFTGTPCQIAGLNGFLRKSYPMLYTVSTICHGVPSPLIWKGFLSSVSRGRTITSVNMRSKAEGWKHYKMRIVSGNRVLMDKTAEETSFMKAFLSDLILRPSCYACPARGNHGSDLTIGDFWGVERFNPEMDDDLGTSVVMVYTDKGEELINGLEWDCQVIPYENVLKGNPSIELTATRPKNREAFFVRYQKEGYKAVEKEIARNIRNARMHAIKAAIRRRLSIK